MNIVFDIDGVLADNRHRFKLIESAPKDWDAYYDRMGEDPVFDQVGAIIKAFGSMGIGNIFLCTGRPTKYRERTKAWLRATDLWDDVYRLFMREDGDFRPNPELKEQMAKDIIEEYGPIAMVFEDDTRSVATWRKYAPIVMEVKHGI
jgi:phosphoglycolate phosphatase-like HAD superfamily hydrolase